MIRTQRLLLRKWDECHRDAFATMHADAIVMADQGGPLDRAASDLKFYRYYAAQQEHGTARWAIESTNGSFLGYAGVMPRKQADHPLGHHLEIGWRLTRENWGHGYATESAQAALEHAIELFPEKEILAYTTTENLRSQAVMERLGLVRDSQRDFRTTSIEGRMQHCLVWLAPRS